MIQAEILEKHRYRFNALASGWLRIGATCVQLLYDNQVLLAFPDSENKEIYPAICVSSPASNLILRISGIDDPKWIPAAESILEIFASLFTSDVDLENLTAALVNTQDRLVAIYELTQATRRTFDIHALLDLLIQESRHLLDVDGGFAILMEKGKESVIHQISEQPLHPTHLEAAAALFRRDPNRHVFKDSETVPLDLRNVMMVSLPIRDEIFAAFGVTNKTGNYNTPDIKLAETIASHIGAQLENAMLHKEAVERVRIETEMDIARQIQTAILPQTVPHIDGLDLYALSTPALEVGGDFFDVSQRSADSLIFSVGDVTGKGMPAAMLMSMTHTVIKSASRNMPFTASHQVLDRLNHDLFNDFSNVGMFTTVFIGLYDCVTRALSIGNAGHSPVFHIPAHGEPVLLEAQDIPVGILDAYNYSSQSLILSPGDILVIASDGFPETRNRSDEMFGYERMAVCLSRSRNCSAREITERLLDEVNTFSQARPPDDDRTIIVIKVNPINMNSESITIHANYQDIRLPAARLRQLLSAHRIPEETINRCELALHELLTNLVEHAYEGDDNKLITVNLDCQASHIQIETQDTGRATNVNLSQAVMPDPMELQEGGYGLAIIISTMDEVNYKSEAGRNTWNLIKKL
jgi:sigma-B regulation protein RsbU (phosphoserine phosphatase)